MIKTLRITSVVACLLAVCSLGLSVAFGLRSDPGMTEFLKAAGAIESFRANAAKSEEDQTQFSPLVKQAKAFASLINPPKPSGPKVPPTPAIAPVLEEPKPAIVVKDVKSMGVDSSSITPIRVFSLSPPVSLIRSKNSERT